MGAENHQGNSRPADEPALEILTPSSPRWAHIWTQVPDVSAALYAVIAQPSYAVEYMNTAGLHLLGLNAPSDACTKSLMEFIPGKCLWTLLNDAIPTAWRVGSWMGELEFRRGDGEECPTLALLCAQPAAHGFPECLVIIARDIVESRKMLSSLRLDQRYLRALLENIPDLIYFKDMQSRFVRVSSSFSIKFGLADPEKLYGLTDFDFFTPEHAQPAFEAEQAIIHTGRPLLNVEEKETYPDGRFTWGSTTKLPYHNEYGQVIGTFGITRDITAKKHTETALAESQRRLLDASRMAGMAEVASGVLHNVGNAFNSVNTSATLLADQLRTSRLGSLGRVVQMIEEHSGDLAQFLTADQRGKQLPNYLGELCRHLLRERETLTSELESLRKGVDHIKAVIAMQQNYAHPSSLAEDLAMPALVGEALTICNASLEKNQIEAVQDYTGAPLVHAARHRVLEILVNLITNAEHAIVAADLPVRRITFILRTLSDGRVELVVKDSGTGISPENLQRIFSFGFTTKKEGHGFGLHNSALAAKEMDGSLFARSEGPGAGAEFILTLPGVPTPSEVVKS
jgi:PAS domain S-box-containing protein